ncbi:hypothetical protein I4U23_012669 [Adineta vaga]|nr:hypothetical protein I4U23_012669 [Adineta vaga]
MDAEYEKAQDTMHAYDRLNTNINITSKKRKRMESDLDTNEEQEETNDKLFQFKETPILEETQIDSQSTLKWCPNFITKEEGDFLFNHLMKELNFEHTEISMYGKPVNLPRLQSWFAEEGLLVKELYQKQKQHVWTAPMRKLKAQLEKQLGIEFDYCLVNLYRDGNDYINFHADNEAKDIIASMTLGATRRFLVRHLSCFGKKLTRKRKPLTHPNKKDVI